MDVFGSLPTRRFGPRRSENPSNTARRTLSRIQPYTLRFAHLRFLASNANLLKLRAGRISQFANVERSNCRNFSRPNVLQGRRLSWVFADVPHRRSVIPLAFRPIRSEPMPTSEDHDSNPLPAGLARHPMPDARAQRSFWAVAAYVVSRFVFYACFSAATSDIGSTSITWCKGSTINRTPYLQSGPSSQLLRDIKMLEYPPAGYWAMALPRMLSSWRMPPNPEDPALADAYGQLLLKHYAHYGLWVSRLMLLFDIGAFRALRAGFAPSPPGVSRLGTLELRARHQCAGLCALGTVRRRG